MWNLQFDLSTRKQLMQAYYNIGDYYCTTLLYLINHIIAFIVLNSYKMKMSS